MQWDVFTATNSFKLAFLSIIVFLIEFDQHNWISIMKIAFYWNYYKCWLHKSFVSVDKLTGIECFACVNRSWAGFRLPLDVSFNI